MGRARWVTAAAAAAILAAGCSAGPDEAAEAVPEAGDPIELRKDVDPGPGPWDQPEGQPGGTLDWLPISTNEGETFVSGALEVDKIRRHESQSVLSVDVRLRNRTEQPIEGTFFIEFRSQNHDIILGHKKGWEPFVVEPFGFTTLTNSALVKGAVGFRLFLRNKGSDYPGYSDPAPGSQ